VWLVDNSPARNITGSDGISVGGETTTGTGEIRLSATVGLIDTTTYGTSLRGISWIYYCDWNTRQLRFVLDFLAQIIKAPGVMPSPLALTNRCPFTYATQFFDGNPASGAFGPFDNSLRDYMVYVFCESRFFLASFLEQALCRLGSLTLQPCLNLFVTFAQVVDVGTGVNGPIRVSGDIDNPHINSQKLSNIRSLWSFDFTRAKQIEYTINKAKVALAPLSVQQFKGAGMAGKWDSFATGYSQNTNLLRIKIPGETSLVIGNSTIFSEQPPSLFIQLIGMGNLGDTANCQLCAQIKCSPYIIIDFMVKAVLTKDFCFPGHVTDPVAGRIDTEHGVIKRFMLILGWIQLDLGRKRHHNEHSIPYLNRPVNSKALKGYGRATPPSAKAEGVRRCCVDKRRSVV
jgi:hypothetical protein